MIRILFWSVVPVNKIVKADFSGILFCVVAIKTYAYALPISEVHGE